MLREYRVKRKNNGGLTPVFSLTLFYVIKEVVICFRKVKSKVKVKK